MEVTAKMGAGRKKRQRCHFMLWPPSFPFRSTLRRKSPSSAVLILHLEAHVRTNRPSEHFVSGAYIFLSLPLSYLESLLLVSH